MCEVEAKAYIELFIAKGVGAVTLLYPFASEEFLLHASCQSY